MNKRTFAASSSMLTLIAAGVAAALALGAPLFLLNYFFAPRPLRFAVGLCAIMLASAYFYEPRGRVLH